MKKRHFPIYLVLFLMACSDVIEFDKEVVEPNNYSFIRNGESTVDLSLGQQTYIAMAEELMEALIVNTNTEAVLNGMFNHVEGENDFIDINLNRSALSLRNNIANSIDFFREGENEANLILIKENFDALIDGQVTTVFPSFEVEASKGVAGRLLKADDSTIIYVTNKGIELNEYFNTALIGGLMVDQILNNHLSSALLDNDSNVRDNDEEVLAENENYTNMEHQWDQAYGYLYGAEADLSTPTYGVNGVGADNFLNKYVSLLNEDENTIGIADDILTAFKLGRAAIVAKNYSIREEQAEVIREDISFVIGVNAINNLNKGIEFWETDKGMAFHHISKALGFIYSLQFTREPNTGTNPASYYTKEEVDSFIARLINIGDGLWEITTTDTLKSISEDISKEFGLSEEVSEE